MSTDRDWEDDDDGLVSKSQRKRDMHAIRDLGKALTEASPGLIDKLDLPTQALAAIEEFKRLPNSHAARKRQLQFIGKMLRGADIEAIEAQLEQSRQGAAKEIRRFHDLEALRDALLQDQDGSRLQQLISEQGDLDIQHLRQLIRQARKEQEADKAPAASRKLFRYLRDSLS